MASRSPSPEPRDLPGTLGGSRRPKAPRKAPQEPPKPPQAPQERFRPAGAVLPAIWRPTAPQELPGGLQEVILAPSARFETLRGPLCEASAAECAPFRGALAIASRPFHSTAPEVKKVRECQNNTPPKRPSKQSLAPKPLANKGARRCGRSHRQYTYTLSQKNNGHNKLQAAM